MGARLPTLLLPAMQCTPRLFAAQMSLLWQHGPVQVADTTQAEDIAGMAAAILATAPPVFRVLGVSMGGYLAFELYRQAPGRIRGMVLCNTSARPDTPARRGERERLIRVSRLRGFVPRFNAALVAPRHADDPRLRAICNAMALEVGAAAFARQQAVVLSRPDSRPLLSRIRCRTLVIGGEHDQLTTPEVVREIADGIPGADLAIISGAGHLPPLEVPDAFNAVLAAWLASEPTEMAPV